MDMSSPQYGQPIVCSLTSGIAQHCLTRPGILDRINGQEQSAHSGNDRGGIGLDKPFPAYSGSEPYVFVCYAHLDAKTVYSDLIDLDRKGANLWYDEGIPAGRSWRAEIAAAIEGASSFVFFISEASLNSAHCLREVDYALNHDVNIIPVYLEDCSLPGELALALSRVHALYRESDLRYMEHLLGAASGDTSTAPTKFIAEKKNHRYRLIAATIAIAVAGIVGWSQRDYFLDERTTSSALISAPSAFNLYLEGLGLLDRWDKDDNVDKAIELFRQAIVIDPEFALAFARLADGLRIRYALTGDDDVLTEASANAEEAARLDADLAPVQVALGRIHAMRGNIDLAFAALNSAIAIDANDAIAHQAIASVYARLGRLDDAESSFNTALALDPDNILILDAYANFLYRQSRFEEASRYWRNVVRIAPDHYAVLVNLGAALSELGRISEAITMYQQAIEIRPTYMAYSNLGTVLSRAERYQDAVDAFQEAIRIDDTDWLAWGNLAYTYSWNSETEQLAAETFEHAIQLAETAREQNPRDPFVNSDLALYYAKTGQATLALQRLNTAVALAPDTGEIYTAAAEVYENIGQRDEAIESAQKALELGISRQQLGRNLELDGLLTDPRMQ